jgi:hypothetical protein
MPTIDLTDDEYAALTAAIRRLIEQDKFPHAPRLVPLRSALAKLDPKAAAKLIPERQPAAEGAAASPRRKARAALSQIEPEGDLFSATL